jgi:hypothetical protein
MHQHQSEMREFKREADARLSRLSLLLRILWVGGVLLAGCLCAMAAKEFAMPVAQPARNYPAHDEHPVEKITVAVDPYDTDAKASIFSVKYRNFDLVPIFFVITNDGDQPISLVAMKAQLNTKDRSKLLPENRDDLLRRLSRPTRNDRTNTLPIPLPKKEVKGGVSGKTMEEIDEARFGAKAVEPHSTARGFLFFDVTDISEPLAGATFYLMGVQDASGKEVMYFEIPLEKYLGSGEGKRP